MVESLPYWDERDEDLGAGAVKVPIFQKTKFTHCQETP
jgi:hypothetical protein